MGRLSLHLPGMIGMVPCCRRVVRSPPHVIAVSDRPFRSHSIADEEIGARDVGGMSRRQGKAEGSSDDVDKRMSFRCSTDAPRRLNERAKDTRLRTKGRRSYNLFGETSVREGADNPALA
jgi:hypothetical protein